MVRQLLRLRSFRLGNPGGRLSLENHDSVKATTSLTLLRGGVPSNTVDRNDRSRFNRTFDQGRCHFTALNAVTEAKSTICLTIPSNRIKNVIVRGLSEIPVEAMAGLSGVISDSQMSPKQLQHEADKLALRLKSRRFPISPQIVRAARREVMKEIYEADIAFEGDFKDFKQRALMEKAIQDKVERKLRSCGFDWKPLAFKKPKDCTIFALSCLGEYFAEMRRVLAEFRRNGFEPQTVLDYGSGIGSAFWAAYERWGDSVREYSIMDVNDTMRHFSMDLIRGRNYNGSGEFITKNVFFRRNLFPSKSKTYDVIPSHEERIELIEKLWKRTNKYLVIVESSSIEAFKAVMAARDFILSEGTDFDLESAKEELDKRNLLDEEMIEILADRRLQNFEKYHIAKSKLPANSEIPTKVAPGFVFAPCPHDQGCPKLNAVFNDQQSCKFAVRWKETRADRKTKSFARDGTLTGTFSYLIMEKGQRPVGELNGRILEKKNAARCVSCKVCTPFHGIQKFTIGKRAGPLYREMRGLKASQLLPFKMDIVESAMSCFDPSSNDEEKKKLRQEILKL